ncbi:polysaccharide deacetylase family protein [Clostridium aminobutyricum]|uniref:Polysaccharide deacetylase n=1 Tax=Clostridium aminobutyricum TaxID=33953 RepID=A0A939IJ85_CLOAM|nr:polysaccharide deacetylase family protein [Clostridium aminobutyricum]MBN7773846.1 polysaccharide deacetylase [Clostridium aminobutyricum]
MYFGSVRFFKHLLLIAMALIVIFSISSCVYMGVSNHHLKKILEDNGIEANQPSDDSNGATATDLKLAKKERMAQYYLSSFDYQLSYPELYIDNDFIYKDEPPKSVYLTFDDGLSSMTPKILDVLKAYGVKATFFIIYNDSTEAQALYKRILDEGHTLGVHSTSHQYDAIYQSPAAFLDDFAQTAIMLEQTTGVKPDIFRFPGGSINPYNRSVYMPIIAEMTRRGYTYYDWNVSADDATKNATQETIYSKVVNGVEKRSKSIVLLHDSSEKVDTVAALPSIIKELQSKGYTFYALNKDIRPIAFNYVE